MVKKNQFEWDCLKAFVAVAELGSIAKAAEALGIVHSTVSRRIGELEDRLQVVLFDRSAAGVRLTADGKEAYHHALTMERSAEDLETALLGSSRKPRGTVRIAAHDGLATYWLARRLAGFQQAHPEIDVHLDARDDPLTALGEGAHIALTFDPPSAADHTSRVLAVVHYVPVASRDYLDTYGRPQRLEEGYTHRLLLMDGQVRQPESWSAQLKPLQDAFHFTLRTTSTPALVEAAATGAGIAILPSYFLALDARLELVDIGALASTKLWLVYQTAYRKVAKIRAAVDWIDEVFDPRSNPCLRTDFVHPREFMPEGGHVPLG